MLAGADANHIHESYVVPGLQNLHDVETYAVLAAGGDSEALAAIEDLTSDLDALEIALEQYPD